MTVTILNGDARAMLATLPADSVQCVVTSPPYYGLRDYGVDGQLGLEATPAEFIAELVAVFGEVRRVLRPDGVAWLNIGDSYAGSGKGPSGANGIGGQADRQGFHDLHRSAAVPAKNLLLIPQRLAIALQDDGWYVRAFIAWCKTSAMPESVQDRPTSAWEPIIMLTRSARYFYDADAVRQPAARDWTVAGGSLLNRTGWTANAGRADMTRKEGTSGDPATASLRNYWLLGPEPSREAHYAAYPTEIPRRCIKASTSERGQCRACGAPWGRVVERQQRADVARPDEHRGGIGAASRLIGGQCQKWLGANPDKTIGWQPSCACDAGDPVPQTVLDPFLGSGTTALVADRLERNAVGIELNPEYAEMARRRIYSDAPMFADVNVEG